MPEIVEDKSAAVALVQVTRAPLRKHPHVRTGRYIGADSPGRARAVSLLFTPFLFLLFLLVCRQSHLLEETNSAQLRLVLRSAHGFAVGFHQLA